MKNILLSILRIVLLVFVCLAEISIIIQGVMAESRTDTAIFFILFIVLATSFKDHILPMLDEMEPDENEDVQTG